MSVVKSDPFQLTSYQIVKDYISLTKPGVMALLLVTTACPMVVATAGDVSLRLVLLTMLGGALVSGSASAINCIYDRDIDAIMERTKNRPIAAGRIASFNALIFSLAIGGLGLFVLWNYLNPLAALIALGGHLFYVFVYTMWLKRSSVQNIVIGGAAGAVPPLVGWAAATGHIGWTPVLLFVIVFLWTPPHFWALALNKNADYRRANVPMLPVIAGAAPTHTQMLWYAISLVPATMLLVMSSPLLGWFSSVVLSALSVVFAWKVFALKRLPITNLDSQEKQAWDVFGFSLVYLSLLFVCLVVDSTFL